LTTTSTPGIATSFLFINSTRMTNSIIMAIFIVINVVFMFMVLKRKVTMKSKEVGVLKALGYTSREVAVSFTVYSFFIVITGGLLSFGFAIPMQQYFINNSMSYLAITMPPPLITLDIGIISVLLPLVAISLFV
jgi:ABC-type lipoprotein release transport system permease subunit